jgi:pimeloyl-ACP methyl ester carboxylesterase
VIRGSAIASIAVLLLSGCLSWHRGALPTAPEGGRYAEVRGARIHYLDAGTGPAVVLIHGFASSLNVWSEVRSRLVVDHRVVALDLKGFGLSDRPPGDYTPLEQAHIVLDLLTQLGIEQAAWVGHSYGASVALMAALEAPGRVTQLALYDAWVFEEQLPTFFHWARADGVGEALFALFHDQRPEDRMALAYYDPDTYLTEELVDAVKASLSRPGTEAAALATARGMRFGDVQWRYRRVRKPVLLLWGEQDRVAPLRFGERLLRELPNATLRAFPQCGHFPMHEAVRPSTAALARFLGGGDA